MPGEMEREVLSICSRLTLRGRSLASHLSPKTYKSRQEFLDIVIKPFNARLSQRLVPAVRNIYTDRDMVIALFDAKAVARDGKPYRNTYTWYMRMRNGKVVDVVAFFDTTEFTDLWKRIQPE
jgi:uncharacterized protein